MQISNLQSLDIIGSQGASLDPDVVSLDDRLLQAFSQSAVDFNMEKNDILRQLESSNVLKEPGGLLSLQIRTSDYNLEASLVNTLTRKAVGVVESLLRS
ncbi:type III secretion system inner rod subunit SctI [Yokenella regensburgei]|uniref:type III secretion system inner rod subunit SctI n=1 Tax=Yokenella regensburgei TaxID=158877 RepID=UPI00143327D4|nr:type III secretion system inner rod subunit SctI [Yokenella regensburgei]